MSAKSDETRTPAPAAKTQDAEAAKQAAIRKGRQTITEALQAGDSEAAFRELMTHPVTREPMDYAESRMRYG